MTAPNHVDTSLEKVTLNQFIMDLILNLTPTLKQKHGLQQCILEKRRAILRDVVKFNQDQARSYFPKIKREESGKMATPQMIIGLLHKSHNAPASHPTMHYFVVEKCTYVHISVTKWCIVVYLSDALWDLWNWSIESPHPVDWVGH